MENIFNHLPKLVNSFGLLCDIVGVVLLWKFGLPESISRTGASYFIREETDADEIRKAKRFDRLARFGIWFLIVGFIFQLISNFVPSVPAK